MPRETKESHQSCLRRLRQVFDTWMPILGVVIILGAVLFVSELRLQLAIVLGGIMLVEAGVWNLSKWFLPNDRKFVGLRAEGDHFIVLIRQLNEAALQLRQTDNAENRERFQAAHEAMHQSVDRMAELAGRTEHAHSEPSEVTV